MPFLTYETIAGRAALRNVVKRTYLSRNTTNKKANESTTIQGSNHEHPGGLPPTLERTNTKGNPNEKLVIGYLNKPTSWNSPSLHIRRTLDQFFFHDIPDITKGDHDDVDDQVVGKMAKKLKRTPNIFMVDQLWLWILDESKFFPNLLIDVQY